MRNWKIWVPIALTINFAVLILPSHQVRSFQIQTGNPSRIGLPGTSPSVQPSEVLIQASRSLNQAARKASPAVVSITSIKNPDFKKSTLDFSSDAPDQSLLGIGSGVIIRSDGIILTNDHVVQSAQKVTVTLDQRRRLPAHVIGSDPKTDLAVIQIDSVDDNAHQNSDTNEKSRTEFPTLSFGDSDQIQVGDWIMAVGSPFGLNRSVTFGIVSAVGRAQLGMLDTEDFIQTDAAINPGNSGGPLINIQGEMVGINTAIFSQSGGFVGIGFAIPSKIAKQIAEELLQNGRVIRGWMGMTTQDLDDDLARYFQVKPNQGALISEILPNGPASQASLKAGDVVLSYDETPIESARQLKNLVAKSKSSQKISIKISRKGEVQTRVALIHEQPTPPKLTQLPGQLPDQESDHRKIGNSASSLGLVVEDIPPEFSELLGVPPSEGAIVTQIKLGSPAFEAGISRGDVILSANQIPVHGAKEFLELMRKRPKSKASDITLLYVQRGPEEKVFVPLKARSR